MSEVGEKKPWFPKEFKEPGGRNYLFLGFASLLVYFLVMVGRGAELGAMLAVLIAAPGLLARWVISPVVFLLLTTYFVVDPTALLILERMSGYRGAFGWGPRMREPSFQPDEVILAASVLGYLIAQYRLMSLTGPSMPAEPRPGVRPWALKPVKRPAGLVTENEIPQSLAVGAACVLFGQLAWAILGLFRLGYGLSRETDRAVLFVWVVGLGILLTAAGLAYVRASRAKPEEARAYLQDVLWRETLREQRRVNRWRGWFKRRRGA